MIKISYLFFVFSFFVFGCATNDVKETTTEKWYHLEGNAQGTTFSIKYEDGKNYTKEIKNILHEIDRQLSTYIDSSLISTINQYQGEFTGDTPSSRYFMSVFVMAMNVYHTTDGAFNPMVFPLVEYWGFGKKAGSPDEIDDRKIQKLLLYMNPDSINYGFDDANYTIKKPAFVKFDLNAIAQGYTVDVIADFLENNGIKNYMIEIGGEVKAKGKNHNNLFWKLGVDKPTDINAKHDLQAIITLKNRSLATSGNYRKFYEKDGVRYSHTIDPRTGYPVQHSLLSTTVLADECAYADAYATAFMVMGLEKSKEFLKNHPELKLDAYLIYSDENGEFKTWYSPGLKNLIDEDL